MKTHTKTPKKIHSQEHRVDGGSKLYPDILKSDDEILKEVFNTYENPEFRIKFDMAHDMLKDLLLKAIALTRKACEKVHTHIKPNCELCFAMWKAGFEDGQKAVLKDSEDKK